MTTNPYSAEAVVENSAAAVPTGTRPGGITVVGVLALILAGLGMVSGLVGLGGQAFSKSISQGIIEQAEAQPDNEGLQMQANLQKEAMVINEKYKIPNIVASVVSLLVCAGLFIAAIMLLGGSAKGRALLMSLFMVVILVDIGKSVLAMVAQKETMSVMEKGFVQGMNAGAGSQGGEIPEEAEEMMGTAMKVGAIIGMVFVGGWLLLKIAFYVWGRSYLKKPEVAAWFNSRSGGGASPPVGHVM